MNAIVAKQWLWRN